MFYRLDDEIVTIDIKDVDTKYITAGYVNTRELMNIFDRLGIARSCAESCNEDSGYTGVEIYEDYTILRVNAKVRFSVILKKGLMLVVEPADNDGRILNCFMTAISKYPTTSISVERLVYAFFTTLVDNEAKEIRQTGYTVAETEEKMLKNKGDENINPLLLKIKRRLLNRRNYYQQLISISTTLEANENEIFSDSELSSISNLTARLVRLREETDLINAQLLHLQDAYHAHLDLKLNQTMKTFTAVTTVFFPLTVIVGWYGMNFPMPEFRWKYGYLYVGLLSAFVIAAIILIMSKKRQK